MGEAKQEETKNKEEHTEENKDEKTEEPKGGNGSPPAPEHVVILVDLHCFGCAKKIQRSIMKCRGVEEVEMDVKENKVRVKGAVNPQSLCSRIRRKTMRTAEVISPPPTHNLPQVINAGIVNTVELEVNMHCQACAQQLRRKILKMRGVQTAETEFKTGKVVVTGTTSAERLVDYIHRRTGKLAKVISLPTPPPEKEKEDEKTSGDKEEKLDKTAAAQESPPEETEKQEETQKESSEAPPPHTPPETSPSGTPSAQVAAEVNLTGEVEQLPDEVEMPMREEEMPKMMKYYWTPVYVVEHLPPPQMFSDENPNACCIA